MKQCLGCRKQIDLSQDKYNVYSGHYTTHVMCLVCSNTLLNPGPHIKINYAQDEDAARLRDIESKVNDLIETWHEDTSLLVGYSLAQWLKLTDDEYKAFVENRLSSEKVLEFYNQRPRL